jgi:uncharacterized protein YgbK (DUF1537 family)
MTISLRKTLLLVTAAISLAGALLWNGKVAVEQGLVSASEARGGRPLTPMSYAGVARRTTRRAVYGTAAAAAAAGAYAATPGCVQVTNAYGQVVTKC